MEHVIRPVRADEWRKAREIRLAALQDPAAPLAFLDTYEAAVARPDAHWQERAAGAAEDSESAHQFVAEAPDGSWEGTVTVLVERPGGDIRFGEAPVVDQTHVVGVYVRPEARGAGLADALFRAAVEWSWSLGGAPIQRVRLYVHERNERAAAFYRKAGFVPTGHSEPLEGDSRGARELEYEVRRPVTV
ncbi:GNAT family N-acetyltransferase [Streptomyces sp. CB03238]|uniref:GNAT family N-acetyltransferase n=1 Tax=Streptomyces sp. CB03238 TaxID=1907777 RepID=UPI000A0FF8FA|nr:GNAT family N-acetyltransferase [Streptomyces sp. CB03238]ORT58942.1 GNAT family N-acetyltransferase [Streptomyces sp. CB03238]